ncbi:uncharacterized protein Z519_02971 [Cladophialophora bantiana CBS 173.52]|uniref:Nitrogen regulatory protein areA GATA-like domain-containing protein n=1 Tax=Cladophialophora bantiana (strain ATCC 10958 / CBS 173.52 / CDC B-1940 / NIH 8579) TaxID=1442370 RepID=A0A0D2HY89_CLAB1|nr:uncharacterized protein Z519_02971 [Cladophialophora bantiana CBS 173.52]KIW95905.1 hypothetical protein Z519_02971 [Cladophialophora bantiana CBS 173.52]
MPPRKIPHVLYLDRGKMHHIDPSNACSLMAMWSMFSKCSETLDEGPRLENLSWRIWSRESLCVTPIDSSPPRASQVPSLSNSWSSNDSLSEGRCSPAPARSRYRSRSPPQDDCSSSLSKSRHLSPLTLEKIVASIQDKTDLCPLSPSLEASRPFTKVPILREQTSGKQANEAEAQPRTGMKNLQDSTDSCLSNTTTTTLSTARQSEHRDSDTSVSSDGLIPSGSVVHGFSPVASSCRSRTTSSGMKTLAPSKLIPQAKGALKSTAMFTLGGSSEDDESSFEQRVLSVKAPPQRSSLSQSLSKQNLSERKSDLPPKRTSFRDVVAERRIQEDAENDEGAIASSDEEDDTDEVVESAIDEDEEDGDDWEDSTSDDGKAVQEPHLFRRVDSRSVLPSRRSMLTLALNKGRAGLAHAYSQPTLHRPRQTSPPQGPSYANSPDEEDGMMMQTSNRPPIAIPPPKSSSKPVAHSPRTTRRNMLSTELTESLRKNLLWERQQKSQTVNAFLKRSRNAQSMANLSCAAQAGGPPVLPAAPVVDSSKDDAWTFDNTWEYHTKGW